MARFRTAFAKPASTTDPGIDVFWLRITVAKLGGNMDTSGVYETHIIPLAEVHNPLTFCRLDKMSLPA